MSIRQQHTSSDYHEHVNEDNNTPNWCWHANMWHWYHVQKAVTFPIRAHAAMRPLARSRSSNRLP